MLERIFDTDNVVFRFFRTLGYIWWLHILWLICSLPVITIGASTTALCYACMKLHNNDGYVTANFFHAFKVNFRQSTILFVVLAATGVILVADLILCNHIDYPLFDFIKYCIYILIAAYIFIILYIFSVQAKFINPLYRTLMFSFVLAGRYWYYTIQMLLILALIVGLNFTIVFFNFITISFGVGIAAYIMTAYHNKIFNQILR